jgi:hypothetical protein
MCEAAETRSYAAALSVPGGLITTTVAPQPAQPGPSFLDPLRARFGGVFGAFLQPIFEIFGQQPRLDVARGRVRRVEQPWLPSRSVSIIVPLWPRADFEVPQAGVDLRGTESLLTHRWREPDSNHRSLSCNQYPKKAQSFVRKVSRDVCARVKCAGGAAILTIQWFDEDQRHARTLYRNPTRCE